MRFEDAVRAGLRMPLRRAGVVEIYVLGFAVLLAARAPIIIGGALTLLILSVQGRLGPVIDALRDLDPSTITPGEPLPPALETALVNLLSPLAVGVFVASLTAAILAWLLGQAVASAAGIEAIQRALGADTPADPDQDQADVVLAGLQGIRGQTKTFLGLALVRGGVGIGVPVLALVLNPLLPTLLGSLLLLAAVAGAPILYFALGFGEQAAVVDDLSAIPALRASLAFVRTQPGWFLGYLGLGGLMLFLLAVLGGVLGAWGQSAATAVTVLILAPLVFDTFKTALYARHGGGFPDTAHSGGWPSIRSAIRAIVGFPLQHPIASAIAVGVFGVGALVGWRLTSRFGLELLAPGGGPYLVAPTLAGQIWVNNWLVAAATAIGGLALGIPTVTNLLFNGTLIGAIAGVVEIRTFLALVVPHGVIEVPAIAIAGASGLVLGRRVWAVLRGRRRLESLADDVRWAFEIVVGLGVVLLVAALVETFLTPTIASALVGLVWAAPIPF